MEDTVTFILDVNNLPQMSEEDMKKSEEAEIDYSEIPPLTEEELDIIMQKSSATSIPEQNFTQRLF